MSMRAVVLPTYLWTVLINKDLSLPYMHNAVQCSVEALVQVIRYVEIVHTSTYLLHDA